MYLYIYFTTNVYAFTYTEAFGHDLLKTIIQDCKTSHCMAERQPKGAQLRATLEPLEYDSAVIYEGVSGRLSIVPP